MITIGSKIKERETGIIHTVIKIRVDISRLTGDPTPIITMRDDEGEEHDYRKEWIRLFLTSPEFEIDPVEV